MSSCPQTTAQSHNITLMLQAVRMTPHGVISLDFKGTVHVSCHDIGGWGHKVARGDSRLSCFR